MKMNNKTMTIVALACGILFFGPASTKAQDFGFGAPATDAAADSATDGKPALSAEGSLSFSLLAFPFALADGDFADSTVLPEGRFSIKASGSKVDAMIGLRLDRNILGNRPASLLDEARLRIFLGRATVEGGLMRVSWGRADSLSVLDVINPRDLSDLTLREENDRKIAVPMLRLTESLGERASVELVYLPFFEGDRTATSGPWVPAKLAAGKTALETAMAARLYNSYKASLWSAAFAPAYAQAMIATGNDSTASYAAAAAAADAQVAAVDASLSAKAANEAATTLADPFSSPDTNRLDYGQAGFRLAAGLGGIDLGLQYFYGYLTTPAYDMNPASIAAAGGKIPLYWNRYHQIGADMATVLAGFNIRIEGGANLTEDMSGDDPLVYNPAFVWAAGFDRSLFAGIDINLQAMGKVRLFHDKITSPLDVEYGSDVTTTQVAVLLSRSFARETVKLEMLGLFGVEKLDCMIEPGIVFTTGDAEIALRGRYFGGDTAGDLGQFHDSSYVELSATYKF